MLQCVGIRCLPFELRAGFPAGFPGVDEKRAGGPRFSCNSVIVRLLLGTLLISRQSTDITLFGSAWPQARPVQKDPGILRVWRTRFRSGQY